MARRRKAKVEDEAALWGCLIALGAISMLVSFVIAAIQTPEFWIGVAILAVIGLIYFYYEYLWIEYYLESEEFKEAKQRIADFVDECNDLNDHIRELKSFQDSIRSEAKNIGALRDTSDYNFKRDSWKERMSGSKVHNCSKTIVSNAQNDPFKYLCKYFGIKPNEQSLSDFEGMLNDFSAAEEGAYYLDEEREDLIASILRDLNPRIQQPKYRARLEPELGFDPVAFDQLSYPTYSFQYVSAGGNSSMSYDVEMDTDVIEEFVDYLSAKVKFRKSVAGQRALMTKALRDSIKERDDFQCQECGISAHDTRNLLLEIDHIKPLSKGGMTCEDNLQTLCWKCNRSKGAKDPT